MNVSHDGKMVAFTAGKDFVLGVDVMCNSPSNPMPWAEFHPLFEENFTSREWAVIHAAKDDSLLFQRFMTHWALKESYIKSIGYAHLTIPLFYPLPYHSSLLELLQDRKPLLFTFFVKNTLTFVLFLQKKPQHLQK